MKFVPRDYQVTAYRHIQRNPKAALFLDVGLGKSVVAASRIKATLDEKKVMHWLIVAPKRVCQTVWPKEFEKWDHLKGTTVVNLCGLCATDRSAELRALPPRSVTIINVDLLPWLIEEQGKHWPFDGILIDESSMFKDSTTKRFNKLKYLLTRKDHIKHVLLLTGSPAAQGLLGLWTQLFLIDGGQRLGRTFLAYKQTFFYQSDYYGYKWDPKKGSREAILGSIADVCITIRAADHLPVSEPIINSVAVLMPAQLWTQYRQLEETELLVLDDVDIVASNAGVLTNKLTQFTSGALYDDAGDYVVLHDAKLDALQDLVTEASGKPILLAYHFKFERERLAARFGSSIEFFNPEDPEQGTRWQAGDIPILAMQPQSGGHGVDGLQGVTDMVVWLSPPWSRERFDQFNGRILGARQIGTKLEGRSGVVHLLTVAGSVDDVAADTLSQRGAQQETFLNALKAYREKQHETV